MDGDRLVKELKLSVGRNTVFDVVMRVRCSTGNVICTIVHVDVHVRVEFT